jgi:cystathionine beta-lyase
MVPPQATCLAWLDCREVGIGVDPATVFLDRGRVALNPGTEFGTGGRWFARFNFGTSRAIVQDAVERMARAIGEPESAKPREEFTG